MKTCKAIFLVDHKAHPFYVYTRARVHMHTQLSAPICDAAHGYCLSSSHRQSHCELACTSSGNVTAMDERGKPRVFTVDTYINQPPPLPPRLTRRPPPQRGSAKQSLLFILVGLALCGMVIEAYCIFQLYKSTPVST